MKKLLQLLLCMAPTLLSIAQYKPIDSASSVKFKIKNFGINVDGTFSGLDGIISFDPKHLGEAVFKISLGASTVNTGNDLRDSHLRNENYFNSELYPRIYFESTRIANSKEKGFFIIYGKLTIKNHIKEIFFPFKAAASADGYRFEGEFSINRRDFEVGGASIISNNAEISLNVLAHK